MSKEKIASALPGGNTHVIMSALLSLLPAQIMASAASGLGSIVNGILVGNYLSELNLAALGFVTPLSAMLATFSIVVSGGARILSGESMGRGDLKEQRRIFNSSIRLLTWIGIAFTLVLFLLSTRISLLLGAVGSVAEPTAAYIRGISLGMIPALLVPALMVFLQINNDSGFALLSTVVLAALSLIFGLLNLRVFDGGIFGMGLSVSISQWCALALIGLRFFKKHLAERSREKLPRPTLKKLLWLGFPSAFAGLLYSLRNSILNGMAASSCGEEAVAALAILNSVMGVIDAINIGLGSVCLTLCSLYRGMGDRHGTRTVVRISILVGEVLTVAEYLLTVVFARSIAGFFGTSGSLTELTAGLLRIYNVAHMFNIFTLVFVSVYQSLGRVKLVSVFYIFNAMLIPLCYTELLISRMGTDAIFSCYLVAELFSILGFYILGFAEGGRSLRISELVHLPEDKGEYLNFSVRTAEEVSAVSASVIEYLKEHGVDARRSYFCGLCLEEIAGNVVEHGFFHTRRKKKLSVDLFLTVIDGELRLRIIDNCVGFNPLERLDRDGDDDPAKDVGIRLVRSLSDEFTYHSTFGQNLVSISWKIA